MQLETRSEYRVGTHAAETCKLTKIDSHIWMKSVYEYYVQFIWAQVVDELQRNRYL